MINIVTRHKASALVSSTPSERTVFKKELEAAGNVPCRMSQKMDEICKSSSGKIPKIIPTTIAPISNAKVIR